MLAGFPKEDTPRRLSLERKGHSKFSRKAGKILHF